MNLVTRDARRSTRHVCGGNTYLTNLKVAGHRAARHESRITVALVVSGRLDADDADFEPSFTVDGRDVSLAMATFPSMVDIVPEGQVGLARVEHFEINQHRSDMSMLRGSIDYVLPGKYACLKISGGLVMSDTRMERMTNGTVVYRARGHVLIAGLGLGMILHPILAKPEVTRVTVLEKHQDVIDLVTPTIPDPTGKLEILQADVFAWKPPAGTKFDVQYFDIWPGMNIEYLAEMARLHRRYARYKAEGAWVGSWCREILKDQKRKADRQGAWYR